MVDQNSYGPTQYCSKCNQPLEKARTHKRTDAICQKCQRKNALAYARSKKMMAMIILFTLFHQFGPGDWIFGAVFEEPSKHSIAITSGGECSKFDGENSLECTSQDWSIMFSILEIK